MFKKEFPYQIHILFGSIWLVVGIAFHTGVEMAIWIIGGLIMILIGFLNRKVKSTNNR